MKGPSRHWIDRCRQRGVGVDPEALWWDIKRAIKDGREDFVQPMGKVKAKRTAYKFATGSGVFAAIVDPVTHDPVTVLSEGMCMARRKPSRRKRPLRVRA